MEAGRTVGGYREKHENWFETRWQYTEIDKSFDSFHILKVQSKEFADGLDVVRETQRSKLHQENLS